MALTAEQQAQVDFETALAKARADAHNATEIIRFKIEAMRMAKEIATENNKIADAGTVIKASDMVAFANELVASVSS